MSRQEVNQKKWVLPGTVLALGWVSFFTDLASEMVYPLLPLFLTQTLGAGAVALGLVEGSARGVSSFLKWAAGIWSDRLSRRKPFILLGYGVAAAVRPLFGFAASWPVVLALRFTDRIGKGIRGAPRDALMTELTVKEIRGKAFGFHRAMDHGGAVVGPLLAALFLYQLDWSPREVFFISAVPALLIVFLIIVFVREAQPVEPSVDKRVSAPEHHYRQGYRKFLWLTGLFSLGNAGDAFFLLAFAEVGLPAAGIAVLWGAHNLVKLAAAWYAGSASDRLGRKRIIGFGWIIAAGTYFGFAFSFGPALLIGLFLIYGLAFGISEPAEKALIADLAPTGQRGSYFGLYHLVNGFIALPASLIFGLLWTYLGPATAFLFGASLALIAAWRLLRSQESEFQGPGIT